MIPGCGHQVELTCSTEPVRALCKEMCVSMLPCGHLCRKKCCEPCNQTGCEEPLKTTKMNICGHRVTLSCKTFHEGKFRVFNFVHEIIRLNQSWIHFSNFHGVVNGVPTEGQIQSHLVTCLEPCGATLDCEHLCKGTCGECFNGRVHRACAEKCGRSLVCGHICNVNCGLSCPPCTQKCEYSCSHSKCRHKCCEPCIPCTVNWSFTCVFEFLTMYFLCLKELCQWSCEHKTCTKKCGEPCNRPRCDEPCKKILPCTHNCAGLCGEICPQLCRVCDKDKLTEFILLGNEDDDDAK